MEESTALSLFKEMETIKGFPGGKKKRNLQVRK